MFPVRFSSVLFLLCAFYVCVLSVIFCRFVLWSECEMRKEWVSVRWTKKGEKEEWIMSISECVWHTTTHEHRTGLCVTSLLTVCLRLTNMTCKVSMTMLILLMYLFTITHWSFAPNHDFATRFLFQLFGSHASGTQDSADKVVLKR